MNKLATIIPLISLFYFFVAVLVSSVRVFPTPYDPTKADKRRIHIIAESTSNEKGYQTIEEYVDFELGKLTRVVSDTSSANYGSQQVAFVDVDCKIEGGVVFDYKPYSCRAWKAQAYVESNNMDLWHKRILHEVTDVNNASINRMDREFHLIGIVGLWQSASNMPISSIKSQHYYSAAKDVYTEYKFQFQTMNETIEFFFQDYDSTEQSDHSKLEMIQIKFKGAILETLNIISIETGLFEDEVYENILQRPLGYGCTGFSDDISKHYLPMMDEHVGVLLSEAHKIEFEVTATKYDQNSYYNKNQEFNEQSNGRSSDTISVELIRSSSLDDFDQSTIQSIRQRDSLKDIKSILNYKYRTCYQIDLRRGVCKLTNLDDGLLSNGEQVSLSFSNNLNLYMDTNIMSELFVDRTGFQFIKRIQRGPFRELLYFEKQISSDELLGGDGSEVKRIVRTYSIPIKSRSSTASLNNLNEENEDDSNGIELESVGLYVFDKSQQILIRSFQFNILETRELSSDLELAKLFDISDECYLNNDYAIAGNDYAWFELDYSLTGRELEIVSQEAHMIKEKLYSMLAHSYPFEPFRIPKFDLTLSETGIVIRALMIDLPPLELMFTSLDNTQLIVSGEKDGEKGQFEELASDLRHCANLCKFYKCKTMSFCQSTHICALSMNEALSIGSMDGNKTRLVSGSVGCKTFELPLMMSHENLHMMSLTNQISKLQHQNYRNLSLPPKPDELLLTKAEQTLDIESLQEMTKNYIDKVHEYLTEHEIEGIPKQTYVINIDGAVIVLIPNRFNLEQDPLTEFDLRDKDANLNFEFQESILPSFHKGLSMHHYKISLLMGPSGEMHHNARRFNGINYDQCALACLDNRCSSFSFCEIRQECILTDIYELGSNISNLVEQDIDCFVAQRDFLGKFNVFPQMSRPKIYMKSKPAFNPSECAYSCVLENDFNCLAFDFCAQEDETSSSSSNAKTTTSVCYYLATRDLSQELSTRKTEDYTAPCTHYSRSLLADFARIPNRKIKDEQLIKLKTSGFFGRTVDQCADICVNQMDDCTAFQFCFDPISPGALQSCTMIESGSNETVGEKIIISKNSNLNEEVISQASKLIVNSQDCHLFSLRRDSTEAHLRDLALNSMSAIEAKDESYQDANNQIDRPNGLSIGAGFLIYLLLTSLSAALACGFYIAKERSILIRQNVQRLRMALGMQA